MSEAVILMERDYAGLRVELLLDAGTVYVTATTSENTRISEVPPFRALDAFEHPMCYVDDPAGLFPRPGLLSEAEDATEGELEEVNA